MEDIVAVRLVDAALGEVGFLTWGRIFDAIDDTELLQAVQDFAPTCGLLQVQKVEVCATLREAANYEYFFEGFFAFCIARARDASGRKKWKRKMAALMRNGRRIYFLGKIVPEV